jgi:DNA-binding NtrC family response regulator
MRSRLSSMRTVLVIDDHAAVGTALRVLLSMHDIQTLTATSPDEGLGMLSSRRIDLVVADMNFSADTTSGEEGNALFHAIRGRHSDLPIILLTAWTNLESAVQLVKAGAADYIAKPWNDDKFLATVENLLELSEASRERRRLHDERHLRRRQLAQQYDLRGIVFESREIEAAVDLACRVAKASVPVLITGPSGSGKERIAQIVHANSAARDGAFVAVNCGALPADLIEAELFGAEAGAYTGAHRARPGRFEMADGGTFFLDEIGNLPLSGQVKLLRVLETGQFEQLGSSQTRSVRVRIISATSADLSAMIRDGRFRDDLFYRLNMIRIVLPALCERSDDIIPLAEHFLGSELELAEDARSALVEHDWPGNVRELRNSVERAKLLAQERIIRAVDLSLPPRRASDQHGAARDEENLTREVIEEALRTARDNISRAAQSLGISRQSFYRRMERFGMRS